MKTHTQPVRVLRGLAGNRERAGRCRRITCLSFVAAMTLMIGSISSRAGVAPGPDAFGYSVAKTSSPGFTNISTSGTRVLFFNDDQPTTANLGFSFNFYGVNYSNVSFNPNGLITFGGASWAYSNVNLTTTVAPSNDLPCIAVLWDDWETQTPGSDAVYFKSTGAAGSRQFIVQWNNVIPVNGSGVNPVTFQARLFEGSNSILFSYLDVEVNDDSHYSFGAFATVGIRGSSGHNNNNNLQWSFDQPVITNGQNLIFTRTNHPPVAINDAVTTAEDMPVVINVLANDSDLDGKPLTVISVTQGGNGVVTSNGGTTVIYSANSNYHGSDSFTYTISDGEGGFATANVAVTITSVNDPPTAAGETYTVAEDGLLNVVAPGVLANDSDVEGDHLTAVLVTGPAHGALSLNTNGAFSYQPNADFYGTDSFMYQANDGAADFAPATVTINVTPVNAPPVAANNSYATTEDSALVVSAPGVLANDADVDGDALTAILITGPTNGTLTLNTNGSFTYLPATNFNGTDFFTYQASDGLTNSGIATVFLTVTPVNDPPVVANHTYTTVEDSALSVSARGVLTNASDVEGDAMIVLLVTGPTNGTLTLNTNGSFTYQPDTNFHGVDSFTYKASDGAAESGFATVTLTVTPVNDPPVAANNSYTTAEDSPLIVNAPGVLANDIDVDGDTLTAVLVTGPTNGTITLNTNGSFTYQPATNFHGTDSFTYEASDGLTNSPIATVTLTVTPVNDPPVVADNSYTISEDSVLSMGAPGVLTNASDVDGDTLIALLVSGPTNGALTLNANGAFNYRPVTNFHGGDRFAYRVNDGLTNSAVATVTLNVTPVNDPPVAVNDSYTAKIETLLTVGAPGVLTNDFDVDGDSLTAILVTRPTNGALTLNTNGSFTYDPNTNYTGIDTFTYKANDGIADSDAVTVTLTVRTNEAPQATNDSYTTLEDSLLTVSAPGVLTNDSDFNGDPLIAVLVTGPAHGTLSLNTNGSFSYQPNADFNGTDFFTYRASDGAADSAPVTVTVTITPANDPPVSVNNSYATAEDSLLIVSAPGVLANDSDIDGDAITALLVAGPTNGMLMFGSDGSFTYLPATNFHGTDAFTYRAGDGVTNSAIATVFLAVTPVNDPPLAANNGYTTAEDSTLNVSAPGVLTNASDVDGDALIAILVSGPTNGALTLDTNGAFTYRPDTNFHGTDSFTYKAGDGAADSAPATITITVTPVNDAPGAANNSYTTAEDSLLVVGVPGVLANDSDLDGDALIAVLVTGPTNGTLAFNTNGSFTYLPATNFNGTDSFTYKASDGATDSEPVTVTLTVTPVNDPPVAANHGYTIAEDSVLSVGTPGVLTNAGDVDGDTLIALLVAGPTNGTLTLNTNGGFTYRPATDFNGPDSFTYKANDGAADSAPATITLTVTPANDAPLAANNSYAVAEDSLLIVSAPGVLANDTDIDRDALTALLVAGPTNGTLTLSTNGSFIYLPATNFNGTDTFTYRASDGVTNSDLATVTLMVNPVNDPPTATNDAYTVSEDTLLTVAAPGVLANDADIDGDPLAALLVSSPANGSLALNPDGSFNYRPATNFNGSDSFTYKANDGASNSGVATVTITVTPVNDPPVTSNDFFTVNMNELLSLAAPGVLGNDSDVEGGPLTVILVAGPTNGALTLSTNGAFDYQPNTNFAGADSFIYVANDGSLSSTNTTVTITVNRPPAVTNDSYTVSEDNILTVAAPGVLGNDTDMEGSPLQASLVTNPTNGVLTLNTDGSFTYQPDTNFNGTDSFTYKANDGNADSADATVTITVTPANDAPVSVNDSYAVDEDTLLTVAAPGVLVNDSDIDGDALAAILVGSPTNGTLTLNSNGSFTYRPNTNFNGSDSFTYKANDDNADSGVASVTIAVAPVNDRPVAGDDFTDAHQDRPLMLTTLALLANDFDVDGDSLTITAVSEFTAAGGTSVLSTDRITYTPPTNFVGLDSFLYTITDGHGGNRTAAVEINVWPPLQIVSVTCLTNGNVLVQFHGIPLRSYEIQTSTNLANWAPAGMRSADSSGDFDFEDFDTASHLHTYYRAVSAW